MNFITIKKYLYYLFVILTLTACSGSDNNDGNTNTLNSDTLTLSTASSDPGKFITVSHQSIHADSSVDIEFRGADGYLINTRILNTSEGSARVMVPPFIDGTTGNFNAGDVTVNIKNTTGEANLRINELPSLENMTPGTVLIMMLERAIESYTATQTNLDTLYTDLNAQVDINNANLAISNQILVLNDIIDQIETTGELLVESNSGNQTLSPEDLYVVDQLLAASIVGMADELGFSTTAAALFFTASNAADHTRLTEQEARDMFNQVLSEAGRGVDGGKVLLGVLAVGAGVVAFTATGPIVIVAGATSIGLAYLSVFHDFSTAEIMASTSNYINQNDRSGYDTGQKIQDSITNIFITLTSTLGGIPGRIASVISLGTTTQSTLEAGDNLKCNTSPEQQSLRLMNNNSMPVLQSKDTIFNFCVIDPGPAPQPGDFSVLSILNLGQQNFNNNPTEQDIANADIQLSGSTNAPTFSWSLSDVIFVFVINTSFPQPTNPFLYGIVGIFIEDVPGTGIGHIVPINSPVTYGNYSITDTEIIDNFLAPSPPLVSGGVYTIEISLDNGDGAVIMFRVN